MAHSADSRFHRTASRPPRRTIVNVSSGLASVPPARTATYSATKAAIHALSEAIRVQYADTSVRVIELVPPVVRTGLADTPATRARSP
ncbi:SDR family NAD(P)-dependent oxidoreductase [Amycolatopsis sp. NPDC101161]|uniref:SDR family NAD(P)-dependent oxidoreductase n=1 Tax=Amycolatopsis sp. NPDC101161 TaxID=3363940 RepID=UPI0037FC8EEE